MANQKISTEVALKVNQLRKQIFEMKLEKAVSGNYNNSKAKALRKEIIKLICK